MATLEKQYQLMYEKTQFKVALKKFLNSHSFYSVDEFFTCTDDMYYWLYDCVNVSYTVIFLLFVCLRHVPHPIVLWLSRIYGMCICMYVRIPLPAVPLQTNRTSLAQQVQIWVRQTTSQTLCLQCELESEIYRIIHANVKV